MSFDGFYIILMKIKFKGLSINSGIKNNKAQKVDKVHSSFLSYSSGALEL
jgi:hypothetical protein